MLCATRKRPWTPRKQHKRPARIVLHTHNQPQPLPIQLLIADLVTSNNMQQVVCYTSPAHFGVACTKRVARCSKRHASFQCPTTHTRRTAVLIRAQDAPKPAPQEDDFEARIAALKLAKGQTPMGEGKKKGPVAAKSNASGASSGKVLFWRGRGRPLMMCI